LNTINRREEAPISNQILAFGELLSEMVALVPIMEADSSNRDSSKQEDPESEDQEDSAETLSRCRKRLCARLGGKIRLRCNFDLFSSLSFAGMRISWKLIFHGLFQMQFSSSM
jgi:hypothetical protein